MFFKLSYQLQGQVCIEANSKEEAENRVKGILVDMEDVVPDELLIAGIEGYESPMSDYNYSIDSDAITITEVEEMKEELEEETNGLQSQF